MRGARKDCYGNDRAANSAAEFGCSLHNVPLFRKTCIKRGPNCKRMTGAQASRLLRVRQPRTVALQSLSCSVVVNIIIIARRDKRTVRTICGSGWLNLEAIEADYKPLQPPATA